VIVNATGAWIDESAASLGARLNERLVSGTKGSHLILDNPALMAALNGQMIYFEHMRWPGLHRVPLSWPRAGRVDRPAGDKAGRTACSTEERDYILGACRGLFPGDPGHAGIRSSMPMPASGPCRSAMPISPAASRAGMPVRRLHGAVPQIGMVGGKWTTYRAFAEETVDLVLADLGLARQVSTRTWPLAAGRVFGPAGGGACGQQGLTARTRGASGRPLRNPRGRWRGSAPRRRPPCPACR
jgi:glycerol-3-phosphate dehydrogenase